MNDQAAPQFGLKPRRFGWHYIAAVCDIDDLLHRDRVECKRHFHFAVIHPSLQLVKAADAAYKVYPFVRTQVFDAQYLVQYQIGRNSHIQNAYWVVVVVATGFGG